jgi:hypothetical protein
MSDAIAGAATLERVRTYHMELTSLRRDIHAHPELGLETNRTADTVAQLLQSWGIAVHRMVNGAGVVGVLRSGNGPRSIGFARGHGRPPNTRAHWRRISQWHFGRHARLWA